MKHPPDVPSAFEARVRDLLAEGRPRTWSSGAQRRAGEAFRRRGLPHGKEEPWRFTPLRPLIDFDFAPSAGRPDWDELERRADEQLGQPRGLRVYLAGNSLRVVMPSGDGGAVASSVKELTEAAFAALAGADFGAEGRDGFALATEALAEDGVLVRVPSGGGAPSEIDIVVASAEETGAVFEMPMYWIDLEANSEASVTELHLSSSGPSPVLRSVVGRVRLGRGATLEHLRVAHGAACAHSVALVEVEQAAESRYRSRVATFGGGLSRLDLRVCFCGSGAECELEGLYMAGAGEIVDHHTLIDHVAGGCSSRQRFKGIATEDGRAIFDGTVVVRRDAQKSVARQENRNLVLSEDAVVHTKPHLEIDADDVVCSHGATVGRLVADEVFYLRSRGIDEAMARAMLTHAFGLEVLDTFAPERLRRRLGEALLARLPEGARLEGAT